MMVRNIKKNKKKNFFFLSSLEDNNTDLEEEAKWANLLSDSDFEG